jgi:hypothetical protein
MIGRLALLVIDSTAEEGGVTTRHGVLNNDQEPTLMRDDDQAAATTVNLFGGPELNPRPPRQKPARQPVRVALGEENGRSRVSVEETRNGDEVARWSCDQEAIPATAYVTLAALKANIVADITIGTTVIVNLDHVDTSKPGTVSKPART